VTAAADLARHERLVDPDRRAQALREASATRRLTSPGRAEVALEQGCERRLRRDYDRLAEHDRRRRRQVARARRRRGKRGEGAAATAGGAAWRAAAGMATSDCDGSTMNVHLELER
jgi:hypothetical protein